MRTLAEIIADVETALSNDAKANILDLQLEALIVVMGPEYANKPPAAIPNTVTGIWNAVELQIGFIQANALKREEASR